MVSIINLPANIRATFQQTLDDYMSIVGTPCVLFFPPIPAVGVHIQHPLGNLSDSTWAAGGPSPLSAWQGHNPYGDGKGIIAVESTGKIILSIHWPTSVFDPSLPDGQRKNYGNITTRGFVSDLTAVLNCTRMETYKNTPTDHYSFTLDGEPTVAGKLVPGRYFYANWKLTT